MVVLVLFLSPVISFSQMVNPLFRRQMLYGSVDLSYEKMWRNNDNGNSFVSFDQNYELGYKGYFIDPRLINFDTSGELTKTSTDPGKDFTLRGLRLNINFLEVPPRQWKGTRRYIPGPISLRYSNYDNSYSSTNYGVSLVYRIPEKQVDRISQREADRKKSIFAISPPVINFEYDKYEYESDNYRNVTDIYSLRAISTGTNSRYQMLFQHLNLTGTANFQRTTLEFHPDYSFYNTRTRTRIDIDNFIKVEKLDETDQLLVSNDTRWSRPLGKDTLYLSGGMDYSRTSFDKETSRNYLVSGAASYIKRFSQRSTNTTSISLSYGKKDEDTVHSEKLSDSVNIDLSKLLTGSGGVFVGSNENGSEYGLNFLLSTKTRVRTSAGYSLLSLSFQNREELSHTFNIYAKGPLKERIDFDTGASYTIRDVSDKITPFKENFFSYNANLFWRLPKTSLSAGGNYLHTTKRDGDEITTSLISLNGNLSRNITRNTFLNVYTTWTRESQERTVFEFRPILLWRARQVTLDLEYNYRWTESPGGPELTEHRVFVRVTRRFHRFL